MARINLSALKVSGKILRIFLWAFTAVLVLVVSVCVAVYLPPVQRFAVGKASEIVARSTGVRITARQFRVRFPLGISVEEATVIMPSGDTLAEVGSLRVHAALLPLIRGKVRVMDVELENTRTRWGDTVSGMRLDGRIDRLSAGSASLDAAGKSVRFTRVAITGGDVAFSTSGGGRDSLSERRDSAPFDWTIDVGRFDLQRFSFAMDMPGPPAVPATPAFDYRHIRVSEAGVVVRDFRYGADDISARFEGLVFAERSGLRVTDGAGELAMNTEGLSLRDFSLKTAGSQIEGTVEAGPGITGGDPHTPVSVTLKAIVAPSEIAFFAPLPAALEHIAAGKTLTFDGSAVGTLDDLSMDNFTAELSPNLALKGSATLRGLTAPERLSGGATLDGELRDLDFARELIADTALRRRLVIPHGMKLHAAADFTPERFDVKDIVLMEGSGRLEGRGSFAPDAKSYDADLRLTDFRADRFLPRDSLGAVTGTASVRGRGFDPATMETTVAIDIERLEYRADNLGRVTADIAAEGGDITGKIRSRSDLLDTDVTFDGRIVRDTLADLPPGRGPLRYDLRAPLSYDLRARIDSTEVRLADTLRLTSHVELHASASLAGTVAALRSGDLTLDVSSPLSPDSLIRGAAHAGGEIECQLAARHFSPDTLQSAFPGMILVMRAGRENFLHDVARLRGIDFRTFSADVSTTGNDPFHIDATARGVTLGSLTLDTLDLHALRSGPMLDYELRMANRPSAVADLGLIRVSGSAGGNTLTANVLQLSSGGATGFDFGLEASLSGNTVRARMSPDPVLGYDRWTVQQGGDWVEYDTSGVVHADLHLSGMTQRLGFLPGTFSVRQIALNSDSLPGIPDGALRLAVDGLELSRMLDLLPTAPDLDGTVTTDIVLGSRTFPSGRSVMAAKGTLGVRDFAYAGRRVADVEADLFFGAFGTDRMRLDATVTLEGEEALTAKGTYAAGAVDIDIDMPAVPLSLAEGFMPPGSARLSGRIDGKLRIAGDPLKPILTGDVGFSDANVDVAMTGTALGISPERVTIADNRVTFTDFGLVGSNKQKLSIDGAVNIANLSAPTVDLTLRARDFQFVNSAHTGGSQIYGKASLGASVTARGALNAMRVRGNVNLSNTTNIVYIMRDDTQNVRDEKQHTVEFVVFADSLAVEEDAPLPPLRRIGVDMLLNVAIGDGLRATVSMDEVNENRVEVVGGGDLTFTMNPQGDARLSGRYTTTGGTLHYKPPVISQKVFAVSDGSYVEWTGPLADPAIHVSAAQKMNVRLDGDDGTSKDVEFDVTANIVGSLGRMDMRFDLSADDLAVQNELISMDAEGRMQQALTLLIYNQYTGSAYSSKGMALDARGQLNNFISKEINQWARNNLKGVDFSMGMSTKDDGAGGSSTDYSYSVSKTLFSDRVKLSIGGKVSDGASAENAANQLLEDVTLEYRLTRRDNMFLKLYRYNTRESILEGEVTETGGGFVIRKKINRLGDIFRRARRPGGTGRTGRTGGTGQGNAGSENDRGRDENR